MIKKFIGLGIVILMIFTFALPVFPANAASDSLMFGDFEYTSKNSYVEINAYKGTDSTVEIPSEINGLKVRKIAENGLCGNNHVEKYILPEGITTIGQHALSRNDNLKEISFPSTLQSVQFGAISYDNALKEVIFPEGLEKIEGCVLYTCYGLTDVYIPSTVTSIAENMFCSSSYDLEMFHVDENNDNYCSENGVLFTKDKSRLVRYPLHKSNLEYEIPSTVTEIAHSAFDTITILEKLYIPDNVKIIGERAFSMASLKELRLPHELTTLPQYSLGSMHSLEKLYIPKSLTRIGNVACTFYETMPTIYYEGMEDDWKLIEIGSMNVDFNSLEFVYNYDYNANISESLMGDCNADGDFSVADVVLLQKWLLAVPDTHLANWKAADFCEDDRLDVFDLCLMKRALIEKMNGISQNVDTSFKLQSVGDIRTNGDNHTNWTGYIARSKNDLLDIIQENEGVSADEISLEDIDASAFNDKSLIIIYGICTAGNSYSIIDDISINGTDIDVSTVSKKPEIATPDMLSRRYIYIVDKNAVTNVRGFAFNDTASYYQYEEEADIVNWFKDWCRS